MVDRDFARGVIGVHHFAAQMVDLEGRRRGRLLRGTGRRMAAGKKKKSDGRNCAEVADHDYECITVDRPT